MASRRCFSALVRHCPSIFSTVTTRQLQSLDLPFFNAFDSYLLQNPTNHLHQYISPFGSSNAFRFFSSRGRDSKEDVNEAPISEESEEEEDEDEEEEVERDGGEVSASNCTVNRVNSSEENAIESEAIGYKVIGPLRPRDRPFKPWEPVFAVVQIGSHQFKVSNGDYIYTERLKYCDVNDKLMLTKVLMLGSATQTIIGRPILPDVKVHAVVEEHALDAKVIIFKKKRRKNYRRTKGHRQELTRLRITNIEGIEKPTRRRYIKKVVKEAVPA